MVDARQLTDAIKTTRMVAGTVTAAGNHLQRRNVSAVGQHTIRIARQLALTARLLFDAVSVVMVRT